MINLLKHTYTHSCQDTTKPTFTAVAIVKSTVIGFDVTVSSQKLSREDFVGNKINNIVSINKKNYSEVPQCSFASSRLRFCHRKLSVTAGK